MKKVVVKTFEEILKHYNENEKSYYGRYFSNVYGPDYESFLKETQGKELEIDDYSLLRCALGSTAYFNLKYKDRSYHLYAKHSIYTDDVTKNMSEIKNAISSYAYLDNRYVTIKFNEFNYKFGYVKNPTDNCQLGSMTSFVTTLDNYKDKIEDFKNVLTMLSAADLIKRQFFFDIRHEFLPLFQCYKFNVVNSFHYESTNGSSMDCGIVKII